MINKVTRHVTNIAAATIAAWVLLGAVHARADGAPAPESRADLKSRYHLFYPTPRPLMREMSTDRPDVTESPYTVDAGHFQAELSFAEYGRDDGGPADFEEWVVLPANLKLGLLNNVDLQLVFSPYVRQETDGPFGSSASGFGETQLRLKVNLWGNDGPHETFGDTALAVMPFVQFPTGDDDLGFADDVEGGVIVPFATSLPHGFGLALMGEFDFVRNAADDGYELEFVHTVSIGHDLTGDVAGYLEYIGVAGAGDDDDYLVSLGAGLTYALTPDAQLDGGLVVGMTDDAEDLRVFAGLSFRI